MDNIWVVMMVWRIVRPMTYETFVAQLCCATKSLQLQPRQMQLQQNAQQTCCQWHRRSCDDVIISGMLLEGAIVKEEKRKKAKTRKRSVWIWIWVDWPTYKACCLPQPSSQNLELHAADQASYRNFSAYGRRIVQNSSITDHRTAIHNDE